MTVWGSPSTIFRPKSMATRRATPGRAGGRGGGREPLALEQGERAGDRVRLRQEPDLLEGGDGRLLGVPVGARPAVARSAEGVLADGHPAARTRGVEGGRDPT